ncbi:MAG: recombination protein RecR [Saprospiraceae bacterium]|nr:recombination protein RecR [Saprospiraceae bacterium]
MNYPSKTLERLVSAISSLPGIGRKTALRLALHLVQDKNDKASVLGNVLTSLKEDVKFCKHCHALADDVECSICLTSSRKNGMLCVVENIRDLMAIEDTASFHGRYHILGGLISPIDGIGPSDLQIDSLISRIDEDKIEELIMAISPTIEGETTSFYISKKLADKDIRITTIARGVSFGGELEYADELTLGRSISARVPYKMGV